MVDGLLMPLLWPMLNLCCSKNIYKWQKLWPTSMSTDEAKDCQFIIIHTVHCLQKQSTGWLKPIQNPP